MAILFALLASLFLAAPAAGATTYTFYVSGASIGQTAPGVTKDYTLNLTNLNSTAALSFNLSISAAPVGWSTQLSQASVTVSPSGTGQVVLSVQPPSNALADSIGKYVNVTATPDDNTTAQTVATTTRVTEVLGVSLTLLPTAGTSGDPGQSITWTAYLKNTGNSQQVFTVALNNTSYTTTNLTSNLVTVSPGDTREILVTVNISTTAQVGTLYSAISATSTSNASIRDSLEFAATVNAKRTVVLSGLTPDDLSGRTESESSITFRNILIENRGNVADSYTLQGTANASRHGDWVSFQTPSLWLPAFTQRFINVTVTVPDSITATVDYAVEFRAVSDNSTSVIGFLNLTITVLPKHDLRMVYESLVSKQSGDPGTTVAFPINVSNPGAYDQRVDLNYSGPNAGWVTVSASPFTLAPGASRIVYVNFSIPGTQSPLSFAFQVQGTINWTTPYRNRTVDLTLEVRQVYDVVASSTASAASGLPGATVTFNVTVKNNGTGADNFTISASNTTQAGVVAVSSGSISLAAGATQNVTVTIDIASAPLPSSGVYYFALTARSSGNVSRSSTVNLALTVRQVFAISAQVTPSYQTGSPGSTLAYTVSVVNDGNGPDTVTLQRAGVNQTWVTFPTGSGTIAAGGRMNFTLQVVTPSTAAPGDTLLTVKAVSSGNVNVSSSATFTLSLNDYWAVSVSTGTTDVPSHRNSTFTVSFTLRNAGNKADTYTLGLNGTDAAWASLSASVFALNPDQTATFSVTVSTPADPANGPHTFTVTATSITNSSITGADAFSVTINDILRPEIRLAETAFFVLPGATFNIPFFIKNNGTVNDTLFVFGVARFPAAQYTNLSVFLLPGQGANRTFTVTADWPHTGLYTVDLTVTSTLNSSFSAAASATVQLEVSRVVDVVAPPDTLSGGPGTVFEFNLSVTNVGNITDTYAVTQVAVPGGGWVMWFSNASLTVAPGGVANFTAYVQAPTPVGQNADYLAGLKVFSTTALATELGPASRTVTLHMSVTYGVSFQSVTSTTTQQPPGGSHTFSAVVENIGSAAGNFAFSLAGQVGPWAGVSAPMVTLASRETAVVQVTVNVPAAEHEGTRTFRLVVTSISDPTKSDFQDFTVVVLQRFGFTVLGPTEPVATVPGQNASFLLTLTNTGNGVENYSFVANPPDYTTFSPLAATLDALATQNITVVYTPPPGRATGTQPLKVTVFGTGGDSFEFFLNATVLQLFNVSARGATENMSFVADPNATVTVIFEVSNRGNGNDTVSWTLTGAAAAWANATGGTLGPLAPGAVTFLSVQFSVPADPLPPAGPLTFTLRAQSVLGGGATARLVNGTLTVGEAPLLRFSLDESMANTSFTRNLDRANPGAVNFTLWVFNLGNRIETVTLTRTPPAGWSVTVNGTSSAVLVLAPGGSASVPARIASFPASASDGQVVFTARGADSKVAEMTITYGIHFERGLPRLLDTSVELSARSVSARSAVTVTFVVVNDGDGTATSVPVELRIDGTRVAASDTIATIAPHGRATVTLTWLTAETDGGATHTVAVSVPGQSSVEAGSVEVTGGQKTFLALLLSDRNTWTAVLLGLVVGVVLGLVMFYRRRKPAPSMGQPMAAEGPAGDDAAMAGLAALEAEGQGLAPVPPPAAVPEGPAPVEHKVLCPECGAEQWIRGAEGECKNCGVVIEVAQETGAGPSGA